MGTKLGNTALMKQRPTKGLDIYILTDAQTLYQLGQCDLHKKATNQQFSVFYCNRIFSFKCYQLFNIKNCTEI